MFDGNMVVSILLTVLALVIILQGVKMVPQGYNWTVQRFGR